MMETGSPVAGWDELSQVFACVCVCAVGRSGVEGRLGDHLGLVTVGVGG